MNILAPKYCKPARCMSDEEAVSCKHAVGELYPGAGLVTPSSFGIPEETLEHELEYISGSKCSTHQ